MTPNRRSRYSGPPRAVQFRLHMLPRLRAATGADNIQVPALRENEVINLAFVEQLEAYSERNDLVNPLAGPETHQEFLEMTRLEMATLVQRLLEDFADCFTEPVDQAESNVFETACATFDTLLYLVARGNITFGREGGINFCKPERGSPTPTTQRKLLARLRADRPIHFMVLETVTGLDIPDPDRDAGHPVKPTTPTAKPSTVQFPNEGFALDVHLDHLLIRTTDYHTDNLVLFWDELFDLARGLGLDLPKRVPN